MANRKNSKSKKGFINLVQVSNKTKSDNIVRSFKIEQALRLLRFASQSTVPTWAIAEGENYKFENNEIIPIRSSQSD